MHFSQRKVVELEAEFGRDVGVGRLLVGQSDVQTHTDATGFLRTTVGCLHDARAATRADE